MRCATWFSSSYNTAGVASAQKIGTFKEAWMKTGESQMCPTDYNWNVFLPVYVTYVNSKHIIKNRCLVNENIRIF